MGVQLGEQTAGPSVTHTVMPDAPVASPADPLGPPPGFAQTRPRVPEVYRHGPTSLVRAEQEQSLWSQVSDALSGFATQPGQIPVPFQMKIQQQKAAIESDNLDREWANYRQSVQVHNDLLEKQRQDNVPLVNEISTKAYAAYKAELDPEKRGALMTFYKRSMESLVPGSSGVVTALEKDPFVSMFMRAQLGSGTDQTAPARRLAAQVGIENYLNDPIAQRQAEYTGHDGARVAVANFPKPVLDKLVSGKMTQQEFTQEFTKSLYAMQLPPPTIEAMQMYLEGPRGEQFMRGNRVQTEQLVAEHATKDKHTPENAKLQLTNDEIDSRRTTLADAQVAGNEHKYTTEYLAGLKADLKVYSGLERAPSGESPNTRFAQKVSVLGREAGLKGLDTPSDIAKFEGTPQYQTALRVLQDADHQVDAARAQASMATQLDAPKDMSKVSNVYSKSSLVKDGKLLPITAPASEREFRTMTDKITVSDKEKDEINANALTQAKGTTLFELAKKAINPHSLMDRGLLVTAEFSITHGLGDTAAKSYSEDLAVFLSQRESQLGNFARSISGERGVLTDQDTARARMLFPTATDSTKIIDAKQKLFTQLLELNRQFLVEAVAGQWSPADAEQFKRSPRYQSKVQGILGNAQQYLPKDSTAKPLGEGVPPPSPVDSLRDRMLKGK